MLEASNMKARYSCRYKLYTFQLSVVSVSLLKSDIIRTVHYRHMLHDHCGWEVSTLWGSGTHIDQACIVLGGGQHNVGSGTVLTLIRHV